MPKAPPNVRWRDTMTGNSTRRPIHHGRSTSMTIQEVTSRTCGELTNGNICDKKVRKYSRNRRGRRKRMCLRRKKLDKSKSQRVG